jgi:rod shape-determining protein MreB
MTGLGIDLGTSRTVVHHWRRGVILEEPSVLVLRGRRRGTTVVATGSDALALAGRAPEGLEVVRPVRSGAVADLEQTHAYLRHVVARLGLEAWRLGHVRAVIAVPAGSTPLERRGLLEAAEDAGLRDVSLIPAPVAGAVGCGADPMLPRTGIAVDLGAGTAEITAFCFGGVLARRTCRFAGEEMSEAVRHYLRSEHRLVVGEHDAEMLKLRAAMATEPSVLAQGRDAASGHARIVTLSVDEVLGALHPIVELTVAGLAACLDDIPAQGLADADADGVLLFGGGSLLPGVPKLLEQALGFRIRPAERPQACVAEGLGAMLERAELLEAFAA